MKANFKENNQLVVNEFINIGRYKARLVVKGYMQEERVKIVQLIFTLTTAKNWHLQQLHGFKHPSPIRYTSFSIHFMDLSKQVDNETSIVLAQRKYELELLDDACILSCKPTSTPMDPNLKLLANESHSHPDPSSYHRLIEFMEECIFFSTSSNLILTTFNDSDWASYPYS
ncbi:hypothetical protein CR513_45210, partial [Mucuna pruriens]